MNPVERYHRQRILTHGLRSSQALGWNTAHTQQIRFDVLTGIADLSNQRILDAGCGRGDLRVHSALQLPGVEYTGIDQMEAFISCARKQYGHLPRTGFITGNFMTELLPQADYVLVSGSLNYRNTQPASIDARIHRLYQLCGKGLSFNLLSDTTHPSQELCGYEPSSIMDYCHSLSSRCEIRTDYLDGDYTIYLHKDPSNT